MIEKIRRNWRTTSLAATLLLTTSCTVGPDYSAPELASPEMFLEDFPAETMTLKDGGVPQQWWEILGDDVLVELIDVAVESNYDIKIARARLKESRAGRSVARADFFPGVSAQGAAARQRQSENSPFYGGGDLENNLFQLGFDASWEIDVFGGVRRSVEAASARQSFAEAGLDEVVRTIIAEVARNYVELRGLQERKAVLERNIVVQQQTLKVTQDKLATGLGTELEVSQSNAQLLSIRSALPGIEASIRKRILLISTLLGETWETRYDQLIVYQQLPQIPQEIYTSTPSEVLRKRPDIRQAESQLAAEVADIGVATAELFPRFSLFGGFGAESSATGDLLESNSQTWSIRPSFRWSVFQGGRVRASIRAQEAQAEGALASYEKTVLSVLQEVNDALIDHGFERQTSKSLEEAREQSRKSVEISSHLYQEGLSDILTVLNTELLLLRVEDEYTASLTREWTSLIRLYKAFGGGWPIAEES